MQEKNNEVTLFTTPLPRCAVLSQSGKTSLITLLPRLTAGLPPQGREITARGLAYFVDTPSSALRATSKAEKLFDNPPTPPYGGTPSTREGDKNAPYAKHPARGEVNDGFTLIELLVVVLIIGILAAVAVPQYQFAVDKSRFAPYLTLADSITKAEKMYFLANGNYTENLSNLDIDFTKTCHSAISRLWRCRGGFHIALTDEGRGLRITYCGTEACDESAWTNSTHICSLVYSNVSRKSTCVSNSARGDRLCKYFNSQK